MSHWSTARDEDRSEAARIAGLCGVVETLILTAGELKEAWECIQKCYHGTQISRTFNATLPEEAQQALKRCSKHFAGTSITTFLRDKFAFHTDDDEMLKMVKALDRDDPHFFYLFPGDNKCFDFATKVRIAAIGEKLGVADWNQTIEVLVTKIIKEVYADVHMVINAILSQLFTKVELYREPIVVEDVPEFEELSANYFVSYV